MEALGGPANNVDITYSQSNLSLNNVSILTGMGGSGSISINSIVDPASGGINGTLIEQLGSGGGVVSITTLNGYSASGSNFTVDANSMNLNISNSLNLSGNFNDLPIQATSGTGAINITDTTSSLNILSLTSGADALLSAESGNIVLGNILTTGTVDILATGNITLSANQTITSAASGDSIVLSSSAGNFINEAGINGLSAINGRWLVYSTDPTDTVMDNLTSYSIYYDKTYLLNPPSTIGAGNALLYSVDAPLVSNLNTSGSFSVPYLLSPIQTPITVIPYQFAQQQQAFDSFQSGMPLLQLPLVINESEMLPLEPVANTLVAPADLIELPNVPPTPPDPAEEDDIILRKPR
jgi:hypothetical protein